MQNRLVVCLCNLKPAKMRGVESQAMVMCASTPEKVEILEIDSSCEPGDVVMCEPFAHRPDLPFMNPKKKIWEGVAPVGFIENIALNIHSNLDYILWANHTSLRGRLKDIKYISYNFLLTKYELIPLVPGAIKI